MRYLKGVGYMFLILLLTVIAIILIALTITVGAAGGVIFVLLFGDVIVCAVFIIWLIKRLIKKKKK